MNPNGYDRDVSGLGNRNAVDGRGRRLTSPDRVASFVPVRSKVTPPTPRVPHVARPAVRRLLAGSRGVPVIFVEAGAGYGKTAAVLEWVGRDPRPTAWLTLDRSDNDPDLLVRSVGFSLGEIAPDLSETFRALWARRLPPAETALPVLCQAMRERSAFVLVIDDVHLVESPDAGSCLESLLSSIPDGAQIALVGRSNPSVGLIRRRLDGQAECIGARELAMSTSEGGELLRRARLPLPGDEVRSLVERTEGWPTGLRLATMAMRARDPSERRASAFSGRNPLVAEYLHDEVIDRLPPKQAAFLGRSAVLEELSGPVCDAVLEMSGSGRVLSELAATTSFVVPLDGEGNRFRYHRLMAEMLRDELQKGEPERATRLLRRASRWAEGHGEIGAAVRYAARAGDIRRAGGLVLDHADFGGHAPIGEWLDQFDEADIRACAPLALARAWSHLGHGDPDSAILWADIAASARLRGPPPDGSAAVAAAGIVRAYVGVAGVARTAEEACEVRDLGPDGNRWYPLASFLLAEATFQMGNTEHAQRLFDEAERASRGSSAVHANVLTFLALLAEEGNRWAVAATVIRRALHEMEANDLGDDRLFALTFAVAGLVASKAGRIVKAAELVRRAGQVFGDGRGLPLRTRTQVLLVIAETEATLGNWGSVRQYASEVSTLLQADDAAMHLRGRLDRLQVQLDALPSAERTDQMLTAAEVRVLQFLPTHHSLGDIAEALFVSRNTIKSHVIAIYRKLGVTGRSQAVEMARGLGYLDQGARPEPSEPSRPSEPTEEPRQGAKITRLPRRATRPA